MSWTTDPDAIIRVLENASYPFRPGIDRERAWFVDRLMNGLTIRQAREILYLLEPGIQGRIGFPPGLITTIRNCNESSHQLGRHAGRSRTPGAPYCIRDEARRPRQGIKARSQVIRKYTDLDSGKQNKLECQAIG